MEKLQTPINGNIEFESLRQSVLKIIEEGLSNIPAFPW